MQLESRKLSSAIRLAISIGAVVACGAAGTAFAQDATAQDTQIAATPSAQVSSPTTLKTVVVTGSRIRRVDLETSSPVLTIDRARIQASGVQTVGDLVQQLPAIAGAATNPNVNNEGGDGAATVSLRGLGDNRTLILVDGHRVLNNDINAIPASMVDRIEVLKSGASATYGSDAIGGVVNFILRDDFQGGQVSANYGETSRSDGRQRGFAATFGATSDQGHIVTGIDYNKFDAISSNDREYSKFATYLYSGSIFNSGSSANPNGRVFIPAGTPGYPADGTSLTLAKPIAGRTTAADYREYDGRTDAYNYAAVNLIQTPQERTNIFALAEYKLTADLSAFMDVFYNKTTAHSAVAPLPLFANDDAVTVSKDNYYNPWGTSVLGVNGIDFGPGTDATGAETANNFLTRFTTLGQRISSFTTTSGQVVAGLKGGFGADSSWQWSANLNYGHKSIQLVAPGYTYYQALRTALGPSFLDPGTGAVTCGTPANPIGDCTPLNIFSPYDPQTIATLEQFAASPFYHTLQISRRAEVGANGDLFELPAGTAQLAVGLSYDKEYTDYQVDLIAITQGANGTCFISQEACSTPLNGSFSDREAYFELFMPLLANQPFAKALNVTIGSRFSKYNTVGSSWNQKFGVEWRPVDDLLLRGTVAGVFRAPNITELYAGAQGAAPVFRDPCIDYAGGHLNACAGVPLGYTGTGLSQATGVTSGSIAAGVDLRPEHGKSYDYGLVYDPGFAPGLSLSLDFWRVTLEDTIAPIGAQNVANICYANDASPFCALLHRNVVGDVSFISQPTVNLGTLNTKGVDGSITYRIPHFDVFGRDYGDFIASLDATYLTRYDNDTAPGTPGDLVRHMAGHYEASYGNFTRWRGLGQLNWSKGPWSANYTMRYIGAVTVGWADPREGFSADAGFPEVELRLGDRIYHNLSFGYKLAAWNTRFDVGVNNVLDRQPPLLYQNSLNSNTDMNTYEAIGRAYWARVTMTF